MKKSQLHTGQQLRAAHSTAAMRKPAPAIQLRPRETTSLLGSPAQSPREGALWSQRTRVSTRLADALGLKDAQEARLVTRLILMGALANIAFVFGRNAGPALYVNHLGSRRLARAMFLSALSVFAVTPRFSTYARPRSAVRVYACVQLSGAVLLACLWVMLSYLERRTAAAVDLTTQVLYTLFFVCEDLTTLLVMMQNAAVAQELFTATAARRVVGLVQLGKQRPWARSSRA